MKIAQIAPLMESVPPKLYGGTERVVSYLCEELVRQGHEVTLFASGDSVTKAELVPCGHMAIRLNPRVRDYVPHYMIMLDEVRRRAPSFDVLHFHIDAFQLPLFSAMADRTVSTLHGRQDLPDLAPLYRAFSNMSFVSISNAQRDPIPDANFVATVYHGLPLKIAAKIDKVDEAYFREVVAPLLNQPGVEFIGEIDDHGKAQFLGNARALLFPIDWPEPFGLVMIEAMACGTPVLGFRSGSVGEIIDEHVTGRIVTCLDEASWALRDVIALDRRSVRRRFEERFSVTRMADDYLAVYRSMLAKIPSFAAEGAPRANVIPLTRKSASERHAG